MTRTQKIRAMALAVLNKRPQGFGCPQEALVAEVKNLAEEVKEIQPMEVVNALEQLEDEGCTESSTNPVLGIRYWEITEKGKPFALKF